MALILFDDHSWDNLLPLTFTRPASALRIGILTIAEKWEHELQMKSTPLTKEYLQGKFPCRAGEENLYVNATLLPESRILDAIRALQENRSLVKQGLLLAVRINGSGKVGSTGGKFPWSTTHGKSSGSTVRKSRLIFCGSPEEEKVRN